MAVILISSDLPEVMGLSHRLALYRDGRIVREVAADGGDGRGRHGRTDPERSRVTMKTAKQLAPLRGRHRRAPGGVPVLGARSSSRSTTCSTWRSRSRSTRSSPSA